MWRRIWCDIYKIGILMEGVALMRNAFNEGVVV